jgi:lactoylglutathione lyase
MTNLPSDHGAQIVHVAILAADAQATAALYRDVFGFRDLGTFEVKNLTAIWLFDGHIYLSVVKYHDDSTAESRAVENKPCIHHLGLEAENPLDCKQSLLRSGCTLVSPEYEMPMKFLTADKIMIEVAQTGYFYDRFLRDRQAIHDTPAVS